MTDHAKVLQQIKSDADYLPIMQGAYPFTYEQIEAALDAAIAALDATAAPVVVGEDVGLLKFVAEVMEDWHEGDLDGGDRQDWAEKYGLLIPVEVTESCGENCGCSEYGDFPLTCYRPSPVLLRCRSALTAAMAGD